MPAEKFNEVFIFVSGSTPQIITETIQALALLSPPVHPDEIHIVTTSIGKKKITEALFDAGVLEQFALECGLPPIPLSDESVHVIEDEAGKELDDIRSDCHNEITGEVITGIIAEKSADPSTRLHCSLAGGRKTMSFYIGSILQLFGRPQDRLYHVLVTPEFETNPSFFYKPPVNRTIEWRTPAGALLKTVNTDDAEIDLISLPFIRLREKLTLQGKNFTDLVAEGQREIDLAAKQPELFVDLKKRSLGVGDFAVRLTPIHMMLYAFFVRRKTAACAEASKESCAGCTGCYFVPLKFTSGDIEAMKEDYASICGHRHRWEVVGNTWKEGIVDTALIRSLITKINSTITKDLQPHGLADQVVIACDKRYPSSGYGVRLDKGKIRIV